MSIDRNDLIAAANKFYPDGYLDMVWDPKRKVILPEPGDTLAEFVVRELVDTFDSKLSDEKKVLEAMRVIERGCNDLQDALRGIAALLSGADDTRISVSAGVDKECVDLCQSISMVPGIRTVESCCGHGEEPYRIWFKADNQRLLPPLLWCFDGCHCGHYGWHIEATTDCGMSPVTYMIQGPVGEEAYKQAEDIAELIRERQGLPV